MNGKKNMGSVPIPYAIVIDRGGVPSLFIVWKTVEIQMPIKAFDMADPKHV